MVQFNSRVQKLFLFMIVAGTVMLSLGAESHDNGGISMGLNLEDDTGSHSHDEKNSDYLPNLGMEDKNHLVEKTRNDGTSEAVITMMSTAARMLRTRIIGGTNVTSKNEFPSYVDVNGCGGTLIDRYFVLTVAHCVDTPDQQSYSNVVYLGGITDTTGTPVKVKQFFVHPLWNRTKSPQYDIAILQLACASRRPVQQLNFNPTIPMDSISIRGVKTPQPLIVIGFGRTSSNGTRSSTLLKVSVNHVPYSKCYQLYSNYPDMDVPTWNRTNMLCAGNLVTGGKDSCRGDSGGPLFIMAPRSSSPTSPLIPVQVGIVQGGHPECGLRNYPGVYTRVSAYESFIKDTISGYYKTISGKPINYCFTKAT
jgi:secreted trypsin-like serine protease